MLSLLFGMSQSVISTMIITTIDILYQEFMSVIRLPRFRGATVAIIYDGSEQKVVKPLDHINEQAIYSAKKKMHTLMVMLGCSPKGTIYHLRIKRRWSSN